MNPFSALERFSVRDLLTYLIPHTPAPVIDTGAPIDRLRTACEVVDLRRHDRSIHYDPRVWGWYRDPKRLKKTKINDARRAIPFGVRTAVKTTAFCMHTAATVMGYHRFLGAPVQLAVDKDAVGVLCQPLLSMCAAAHSYNRFSISLEISGHSDITPEQARTARALIRYAYEEVIALRRLEGSDNERMAIGTHFNATNKRGLKDCGPDIWRGVAAPMIKELGLVPGPVIGKGQAVPEGWMR